MGTNQRSVMPGLLLDPLQPTILEQPALEQVASEDVPAEVTKPVYEKRKHAEIPEFEDPQSELKNLPTLTRPDRQTLDSKVTSFQAVIDTNKRQIESINKRLEEIRDSQAKKKLTGSAEREMVHTPLLEVKARLTVLFDQRRELNQALESAKVHRNAFEDKVKAIKSKVGRFQSHDAIEDEIRGCDEKMMHSTLTLREEKDMLQYMKTLRNTREDVDQLTQMESQRTGAQSAQGIYEQRKLLDAQIDDLKAEEKTLVAELTALREKFAPTDDTIYPDLCAQRNVCRDTIGANISTIRGLRDSFRADEDKYFETDRLFRALKNQVQAKNATLKAERIANAPPREDGDQEEEEFQTDEISTDDPEIDWAVADQIALCEQLAGMLQTRLPKQQEPEQPQAEAKVQCEEGVYDKRNNLDVDEQYMIYYNQKHTSKNK